MDGLQRRLDLRKLLKKKSFFLFGPRATGKSWLIRQQLRHTALTLDLLKSDFYLRFTARPADLEDVINEAGANKEFVVIDEVQKVPGLLDEVHRLIEEKGIRFLLTGSSARKLKRGQANLLAGRAWATQLYPLSWSEVPDFDLDRYLRFGGLPAIYLSSDPAEELGAYVKTYLYEEIQAEGIVRKLPQFSRFLQGAALANGQLLNFANISSDSGVPAATVREYYSILEDTLLGFSLAPWTKTKKRKAIATAKFYFFDPGVTHTLAQTKSLERNSDLYGRSFEQWIGMELRAWLNDSREDETLSYWRSTHQHEIDFILGDHTAIEVKATRKISERDLNGLKAFQEERKFKNYFLVSQDPIPSKKGSIRCLHWRDFLGMLWGDEIKG